MMPVLCVAGQVFALALLNDVPFFLDFPRLSSVLDSGNGKLDWALNTTGTPLGSCLLHVSFRVCVLYIPLSIYLSFSLAIAICALFINLFRIVT